MKIFDGREYSSQREKQVEGDSRVQTSYQSLKVEAGWLAIGLDIGRGKKKSVMTLRFWPEGMELSSFKMRMTEEEVGAQVVKSLVLTGVEWAVRGMSLELRGKFWVGGKNLGVISVQILLQP